MGLWFYFCFSISDLTKLGELLFLRTWIVLRMNTSVRRTAFTPKPTNANSSPPPNPRRLLTGLVPTWPTPHSGSTGNQAVGRRAAPGVAAGPAPQRLWEGVWSAGLWGDLYLCSWGEGGRLDSPDILKIFHFWLSTTEPQALTPRSSSPAPDTLAFKCCFELISNSPRSHTGT